MKLDFIYKTYEEVEIGDQVISEEVLVCEGDLLKAVQGTVAFKGTLIEIGEKYGKGILDPFEPEDFLLEEYSWVVISPMEEQDPMDKGSGPIVYNYNCDPCGVVAIKKINYVEE